MQQRLREVPARPQSGIKSSFDFAGGVAGRMGGGGEKGEGGARREEEAGILQRLREVLTRPQSSSHRMH